jgi:two-component system phosphate regulon sensor histidine kinase PhoR
VLRPTTTSISANTLRILAGLAGWLFIAWIVGLALSRVGASIAVALALFIAIYLRRLTAVLAWLKERRSREPPDYEGVWGDLITIVSRLDRRKQFHKRRVVEMLREFRRLTSAMPDGVVLLNTSHEIVWFNDRAGQWLKLNRKRDIGIRIENFLRHPEFIDYVRRVEIGETIEEPPVVPMPGETNRWMTAYLVQTRDSPQHLIIVRDVTHQVQLETMRKEFVANASHELRSPLTVVSGYLDALGDDSQLDEGWREPVREMRRQADRMRAIIDDLLELSRLEDHRETAGDDPVDVGGLLAVLRKDIASLPEAPHTIDLAIDSTAKLRGEERELASVFGNLVSNAVKYTPRDGAIHIRWWVDQQGGHVAVTDTGPGIAAEHIPRLTERFYRVDSGRARTLGGSGLGLAIVKHALQRHDAHLEIQSELGKGSSFVCHFPVKRVIV